MGLRKLPAHPCHAGAHESGLRRLAAGLLQLLLGAGREDGVSQAFPTLEPGRRPASNGLPRVPWAETRGLRAAHFQRPVLSHSSLGPRQVLGGGLEQGHPAPVQSSPRAP